jgi:hypothetical protein
MRFLASVAVLASAATNIVFGQWINVQYYSDGGCEDYLTTVNPWTNGDCYQFQWGGTNSVNIVDSSSGANAQCDFFPDPDCGGSSVWVQGPACKSNWGQGFQSMKCWV